ncbi:pV [Bottlenose dolphin adenovirus 1]|uniref:PV n=1 Tax=Bottlenose dolphin adenovirus 1 TaxID=1714377 RepID=A0A1X7MN56_9ADEN|nr:pV [Bottlenose dolphin adenovirus 1]SMG83446.1 pV [Bottlenose dolphin adenovirus 1]
MTTRKIKEELLEYEAPEIYRRKIPKRESKVEIKVEKGLDTKAILKPKYRRKKKEEDSIQFINATAPRRPYQWKGRKVQRVLRPGTVVVFSPGQRTSHAMKRVADEMYADEDILEQMEKQEGEFAYGKKAKEVLLDTSNPTPSMRPITPQIPLPPPRGVKREGEMVSTVQLLENKKRRIDSVDPGQARVLPSYAVKRKMEVEFGQSKIQKVDIPEKNRPMKIEDITVRDTKKIAPGIGIQTIDVKVEVPKEEPMIIDQQKQKIIYPTVRLHPSQMGFSKYVRPKRRRKTQRKVKNPRISRASKRFMQTLPYVAYHPSIKTKRPTIVWR